MSVFYWYMYVIGVWGCVGVCGGAKKIENLSNVNRAV